MTFLVIGGTGFIGPPVVSALLRRGHRVAVFHRGGSKSSLPSEVEHILGDRKRLAEQRTSLVRLAPDVVIDLILSSGSQAEELMQTVRGVARRVVAISSIDVYRACGVLHGAEPGPLEPLPLTEDSPLRTRERIYPPERLRMLQGTFGWLDDASDKIPAERAVLAEPRLPGTVLRLPMVYGPGDPLHRFFPLLKRIADGRQKIPFSADVAAWRAPRGYVEDVASAIALAATRERAAGRVYNVAEEQALSELEWARRIAAAAGWRGEFVVLPRERAPKHLLMPGNLEQHWAVSSRRIREELGYHEPTPGQEAMARTIAWEHAHPPPPIDPQQFDYAAEDAAVG
jgi:nucleoside-diphosphate-sugar epimerase